MKNVSFNLSDAEFILFEDRCFEARKNKSDYLRGLIFPIKDSKLVKTENSKKALSKKGVKK